MPLEWIVPDWPAPANVRALVTTRSGGVSSGAWASLNLADHVGDDPAAVMENRRRLRTLLPDEPVWLRQIHGTRCIEAAGAQPGCEADAAYTLRAGVVCAVLTADCLPLFLCDDAGNRVAVVHAGWRGLAAGVIEATVRSLGVPSERLMAWLGPAIGPDHFEVGEAVYTAFCRHDPQAIAAFAPKGGDKWLCDIYRLARQRLNALGISRIAGANRCTVCDAQRFFSYRRDGVTGRMANLIWRLD